MLMMKNTTVDRVLERLSRNFRSVVNRYVTFLLSRRLMVNLCDAGDNFLTLNVGCANNHLGDVRLDIEHTEAANIIADARYLPFRDKSFDLVMLLSVLHHVKDYDKAISEAARVCKRFLIGYEPNIFHPYLINLTFILGLTSERGISPIKLKRKLTALRDFKLLFEEYMVALRPYLLFFPYYLLNKFFPTLLSFDKYTPNLLRGYYLYVCYREDG